MAAAPSASKARRTLPLTAAALLLLALACLMMAASGATAAETVVNRKLLLSTSKWAGVSVSLRRTSQTACS